MRPKSLERPAFAALLAGAVGIGFAPIFVRLSELGPSATAFYRLFFALPILWLWLGLERRQANPTQQTLHGARPGSPIFQRWMIVVAGLCFAIDLALWHW